jgi:pimeloyl-ACP methyl ester carboxylesterase
MEPTEHRVNANGLDIAYLACGERGPLALCLHGFPDSAWTWRHLLPELADAGYRAVAPWLRGYAPTSLDPEGRYQNGASVADAVALHEALGGDSDAVLIGHDWGARIATGAAVFAPERWAKLVTAAVPPGGAVGQGFLTYKQLHRSWYMFFFQTAFADIVVPMNDLEFIDHLWEDWSPGYDARDDLPHVKDALRDPANLSAAIEYYRATLNPAEHTVPEFQSHEDAIAGNPAQPHLYLHGADDGCMGVEVARLAEPFMTTPGSALEIVDDAGHFLQLEQPKTVNRLIIEFLT